MPGKGILSIAFNVRGITPSMTSVLRAILAWYQAATSESRQFPHPVERRTTPRPAVSATRFSITPF